MGMVTTLLERKIVWALLVLFSVFLTTFKSSAVEVDWQNLGQANSTVLNSGSMVNATNNNCADGVTNCDVIATVTFEIDNDGQGGEIECGWNSGSVCGAYFSDEFGGINDDNLRFAIDATGPDNDDRFNMCVEFNSQVEGLTFDILDVDDAGWDDVVELYYASEASATPMLARTDLINAAAFGDVGTGTDANHVIAHSPSSAAPNNEALGWGSIQPNGGNAGNSDDGGNITIDFGTQRVWGFCMSYWAGPNSDANPPFQWVGLSNLNWTASLPVNLDFFTSSRRGNRVDFEWSTSSESFNIGFNLWGEVNGEWVALNRNFIPSKKINSHAPQDYKRKLRLNRSTRGLTRVGISSVDGMGKEEFYGPFEIGEEYGSKSVPEAINWEHAVSQKAQRMKQRGFVNHNGRWIKKRRFRSTGKLENQTVEMRFESEGMVRLTHKDLMAAGYDLRGLRPYQIAISKAGKAVPRLVRIGNRSRVFNERSVIDFFAEDVTGDLALYNSANVYHLSTDPNLVMNMRTIRMEQEDTPETRVIKEVAHENDRYYMNVSTTGSPWLDQAIGYGAAQSVDFDLSLPKDYVGGTDLELEINLMGGFDFGHIEEDHHLLVTVNGNAVDSFSWGGIDGKSFNVTVPAAKVSQTANTLTLTAQNNALNVALLLFDNFKVKHVSKPTFATGLQRFTVPADSEAKTIKLSTEQRSRTWVFGRDKSGNVARLAYRKRMQMVAPGQREITMEFAAMSDPSAEYLVLGYQGFIKPNTINVYEKSTLKVELADLYIVADEAFIGQELNDYVDFKRATGLVTRLVSYQDIVQEFGFGLNDPIAISRFLNAQGNLDDKVSVLLVGGHTYDYLDRTGQGSVSFIPSAYRPTSYIQFSPTDGPIADLDGDGLVDVSLGRWPVRNMEQLATIIKKSIAWQNGEGLALDSSVLLMAEADDANNSMSFAGQLDNLESRYGANAANYPNFWGDIEKVYATDFAGSQQATVDQQEAIRNSMNDGNALTIYSGHGSPTSWSFKRLMDVNGIDQLETSQNASIVVPLACYTTYFETLTNESLANKLLFKEGSGAVMIVGAATLGDYAVNGKMLNRMMKAQAKDGMSMGRATTLAKRSLGQQKVTQTNLWTVLGDPTIKFNANYTNVETRSQQSANQESKGELVL